MIRAISAKRLLARCPDLGSHPSILRPQEPVRRKRKGQQRKETPMALLLSTQEGLYRSNGATSLLGEPADFLALARAPRDPNIYYAAATDGRVFRSRDAARSWEMVGMIGGYTDLSSLAVHLQDPDHLLAGM